jgi:hypothetical protein
MERVFKKELMWIYTAIAVTFCSAYFFLGMAPIVIGAWYGMWHVFWLAVVAWIVNLVLISCIRKSRMLD